MVMNLRAAGVGNAQASACKGSFTENCQRIVHFRAPIPIRLGQQSLYISDTVHHNALSATNARLAFQLKFCYIVDRRLLGTSLSFALLSITQFIITLEETAAILRQFLQILVLLRYLIHTATQYILPYTFIIRF